MKKTKKNYAIIVLIVLLLALAIGYAAFSSTLTINGTATGTGANACQVTSPTDVYPVVFYDQTVLPSTAAGKAVLYGK